MKVMAVQCEDVGCGGFRPSHLTLVDNHIVSRKKNKKQTPSSWSSPHGPSHSHVRWQRWEMKMDDGRRAERGCGKPRR